MASLHRPSERRRQPLTIEVERSFQSNESSGPTPEPSPEGPPKATEYVDGDEGEEMLDQLPEMNSNYQQQSRPFEVEETAPISLPRAPSPYSPPPDSLFSGEEPIRVPVSNRNRPPLHEVSIDGRTSNLGNGHFSFEAEVQQQLRQLGSLGSASSFHSSPHYRSYLVPAVVQLKRELLESQQSNFLLQKEHEALSVQHQALEKELRSTIELLQKEVGDLRDSGAQAEQEHQTVLDQMNSLQQTVQQIEAEKKGLDEQVESLQVAQSELKSELQQQNECIETLTQSNQQLQETKASLERQIQNLDEDKRLLKEELFRLNEHLDRENATATLMIPSLQQDKESLSNELRTARGRIEALIAELQQSQQQVVALSDELKEGRLKLKHVMSESSQRASELQEQLTSTQNSWQQEQSSMQLEVDRLKAIIKEHELESTKRSTEVSKKVSDLQEEILRLEKALKSSTLQTTALRGEKLALRKELAQKVQHLQRYENLVRNDVACQTDLPELLDAGVQTEGVVDVFSSAWSVASDHDSISDRLGRIRDASDRATLLQEYRREVHRIKVENQNELQKLEDKYNESLQRVINEAKEEVNTQTREYKRQLKTEWEAKVASLERRHQQQLEKAREEYESNMAVADVAVEAATSELVLTREELEREQMKRRQLEETALSLKVQVETHKRRERELSLQKEDETRSLLHSIRDECNLAFDRRGVRLSSILSGTATAASSTATLLTASGSKSSTPRSVAFSDAGVDDGASPHSTTAAAMSMMQTPRTRINSMGTPRATPSPTVTTTGTTLAWAFPPPPNTSTTLDLDRALDETEALVRSLVGA